MVHDFLFELGFEELPSAAVSPLAEAFAQHFLAALEKKALKHGAVKCFATPRRFALMISALQAEQSGQTLRRRGPAKAAAYDSEGKPSPALLGFAKSCGVELAQLSTLSTDKGEWIIHESAASGVQTKDLLPVLISQSLTQLPIAKPMRWGEGRYEFIRPVHWALLLYGDELIEHEFLGVRSERYSRGHRFHHPDKILIQSPQSYESQMEEAFVLADFSLRRQRIETQVQELANSFHARAVMPSDLVDEVTSIVEWPQALKADFEQAFLEVPPEALIASMQTHQKTFALVDEQGRLLPHFITVANIASKEPQEVVQGNERVMRARLSDAAFFFNLDKKQPLSQRIPEAKRVVFQAELGSLQDKALRIQELMTYLSSFLDCDKEKAQRAALLSKCDLLTGMVNEFPELEGTMGYYYALNDGESPTVAQALKEQYLPRFAADQLPESLLGKALSLADRIDTLVGIFALGKKPTADKDPFKLRRHALALVRLLIVLPREITISELIEHSLKTYGSLLQTKQSPSSELKSFILERLQSYYQGLGLSADMIQAVRARQDESLYDLNHRLMALKDFIIRPEAASLSAACKRVNNLLSQQQLSALPKINPSLLTEVAEQNLHEQLLRMTQTASSLYEQADYPSLLKQLSQLKEPIDLFFDQVMVMVDDETIKKNRLALLQQLQELLQGVADISLLQLAL